MADGVVWERDDLVTENASGDVLDDCDSCCKDRHLSACELSTFELPDVMNLNLLFHLSSIFVDMQWEIAAVGGISEGWHYNGGDVLLCGTFYLREAVFYCNGGTWKLELSVVNQGIQDSYMTNGTTLRTPMTLISASSPRVYQSQTPGLIFICNTNDTLFVSVRVHT